MILSLYVNGVFIALHDSNSNDLLCLDEILHSRYHTGERPVFRVLAGRRTVSGPSQYCQIGKLRDIEASGDRERMSLTGVAPEVQIPS